MVRWCDDVTWRLNANRGRPSLWESHQPPCNYIVRDEKDISNQVNMGSNSYPEKYGTHDLTAKYSGARSSWSITGTKQLWPFGSQRTFIFSQLQSVPHKLFGRQRCSVLLQECETKTNNCCEFASIEKAPDWALSCVDCVGIDCFGSTGLLGKFTLT